MLKRSIYEILLFSLMATNKWHLIFTVGFSCANITAGSNEDQVLGGLVQGIGNSVH